MENPWSKELGRFAALMAAAILMGVIIQYPLFTILLSLCAYTTWHIVNIFRLERWLRQSSTATPPHGIGIWEHIFYHLYQLQVRHRKQKQKLTDQLKQFKESATAFPDATVVINAQGEIEWFNRSAMDLLGLKSPTDFGQRIISLVRHPRFAQYYNQRQYQDSIQIPSPVKDHISLHISIIPFGQELYLLVARDISRIIHLEKMRSDFIANVSHELRTPLTVISGLLETLQDNKSAFPQRHHRPLDLMTEQSQRMQRLIEDLLLLTKLETEPVKNEKKIVDIPALIRSLAEEAMVISASKQHEITLDIDDNLYITCKEKELASAFMNLISNAIRYTPAQGHIRLSWYSDIHGAHFTVTDNGIGIATQHISRLTERFYRVDVSRSRDTGGTGLGLAIVKHVLERTGGSLHINSEIGKGSCFRCDFPPHLIHRPDILVRTSAT